MSDARQVMLRRIRTALGTDPTVPEVPRDYDRGGTLTSSDLLELFVERVEDYRARVVRCEPDGITDAVSGGLGDARCVVVPAGLDRRWVPDRVDVVLDDADLPHADLDEVDAVVTAAAVGIAETGTIVLDGSSGQGRRAATLVPDLHVCVVHTDQVVETVPEGVAALDAHRPQTWISGPSATSDIELSRVEGVHGPRTLFVVLVETSGPETT